jgi:hypothetical protein
LVENCTAPEIFDNATVMKLPSIRVSVESKAMSSSGRWYRCTGLSCVSAIALRDPVTDVPPTQLASSKRSPPKRWNPSRNPT